MHSGTPQPGYGLRPGLHKEAHLGLAHQLLLLLEAGLAPLPGSPLSYLDAAWNLLPVWPAMLGWNCLDGPDQKSVTWRPIACSRAGWLCCHMAAGCLPFLCCRPTKTPPQAFWMYALG